MVPGLPVSTQDPGESPKSAALIIAAFVACETWSDLKMDGVRFCCWRIKDKSGAYRSLFIPEYMKNGPSGKLEKIFIDKIGNWKSVGLSVAHHLSAGNIAFSPFIPFYTLRLELFFPGFKNYWRSLVIGR